MDYNQYPFTVYDNALGFANAFRLLLTKTSLQALMAGGTYADASMIMPTVVNGAFACELFLKALMTNSSKKHSIIELLDDLDIEQAGIKEAIKCTCVSLMKTEKHDLNYDGNTFDIDLRRIDKAFVKLRYWHEPNPDSHNEVVCNLDFLEAFLNLLQTICEQKYGPRPLVKC